MILKTFLGNPKHQTLCGSLRGRIVICNFFIDLDGASWDQQSLQRVFDTLWLCKSFLEREATRSGVSLDIDPTYYYSFYDSKWPVTRRPRAQQAFRLAGLCNRDNAITYLQIELHRHPIFLFHYMLESQSYAYPDQRIAMTYYSHNAYLGSHRRLIRGNVEHDQGVYAHEILHLFGARHIRKSTVGDVMHFHMQDLNQCFISDKTRREIGWSAIGGKQCSKKI